MSERLVLVERFEDLRAGMLVVVKPCECGGAHRMMLIDCREPGCTCLVMLPQPSCLHGRDQGISEWTVSRGVVFRVVDDTEQTEQVTTARPRVKVDAR